MKIKTGTTLVFESGEYSDYGYSGVFEVLRDFDQAEVSEEFRAQWTTTDEYQTRPDEQEFVAWMSGAGYVKDKPYVGWHVGSYGFDPTIDNEPAAT